MSQHKRARKERRREARSVERAKAKLGIKARVEAVRVALRDPGFDVAVNDALRWEHAREPHRHVDQVRDAALGVLRERGIDVEGINLKIHWTPRTSPPSEHDKCRCEHARLGHRWIVGSDHGPCCIGRCECSRFFDQGGNQINIDVGLTMEAAQQAQAAAQLRRVRVDG